MHTLNRGIVAGLVTAASASIFFAWLARAVMTGTLAWFDLAVRDAIHSWASPNLTRAMRGVTQLGSWPFLVALGLATCWGLAKRGHIRATVMLAIAALGGEALDQALKLLFRRPRPEAFFGQPLATYSFPSGHSVESCCFYGALAAIVAVNLTSFGSKAGIWIASALITMAVGFSRVYLGVHYPTDVLGGYAVAVVWVSLVWTGYQVWRGRRNPRHLGNLAIH